jgi:hypothetical protein
MQLRIVDHNRGEVTTYNTVTYNAISRYISTMTDHDVVSINLEKDQSLEQGAQLNFLSSESLLHSLLRREQQLTTTIEGS